MTDQDLIGALAKCIMEVSSADGKEDEDPFERYGHELRCRFHSDVHIFSQRLMQGYHALLGQLRDVS